MSSWKNVQIERDGETHTGKYRVEGGIITVTYDAHGGGDKATHVGNSEPEQLAKLMLSEIVIEARNKEGQP